MAVVFVYHFTDTKHCMFQTLGLWMLIKFNRAVFQEMNLLVEADQPGNQLDHYVSQLNAILSQKAAGILKLQNRLAQFQRRLKEHDVLVSSQH